MKRVYPILLCVLFTFTGKNANSQKMDNKLLGKIIAEQADTVVGSTGSWQLRLDDVWMMVITDERHNRMRIVSTVASSTEVSKMDLVKMLEANFHSALDVRYAMSDGFVWSCFIHPLEELSGSQFKDALVQVRNSVLTYGSSFSSTHLVFPSGKD